MGCSSGREKSSEEQALENAEKTLGYWNLEFKVVLKEHKNNSVEGIVSTEQWKDIAKNLKLAASAENPSESIVKFYDEFKYKLNSYHCKKLLLLSALLSKGTSHEKSAAVFDQFSKLEALKTEDLGEIFDEMSRISVELLPTLISEEDMKTVTQEAMDEYLLRARLGMAKTKANILAEISGGRDVVQKGEFMAWFHKAENKHLFQSNEWRRHLRANGKAAHAEMISQKEKDKENETVQEEENRAKVGDEEGDRTGEHEHHKERHEEGHEDDHEDSHKHGETDAKPHREHEAPEAPERAD